MKISTIVAALAATKPTQATLQKHSKTILRVDNRTFGPRLEEVHYYYDQWPIGLSVSSKGRIFTCYTRGSYKYTLGETVNKTAEKPYPSADLNLPPDTLNTIANGIPFGSNNATAFISVQALFITPETDNRKETLWALDTGRPIVTEDGKVSTPYGAPGGPKLVAIDLSTDSISKIYTFPPDVHCPDSYMNDLRFDLRPNVTLFGKGVVFIVDSSNEGRPGFIMLDLGTGKSWRRLTQHPSTLRVYDNVGMYQNTVFYQKLPKGQLTHLPEGNDGATISADGEMMYYSPMTSDNLYSIPTKRLLDNSVPLAEQAASNAVSDLGQRGGLANGFESDSNGLIYMAMPESNAINIYDPKTLQATTFVRDPRILWPDSMTVAEDGYLYVNINQRTYQPNWNNGTDLRIHPGAILRAKLPNGGKKIKALY